jgi:ferric-dicitrate binding protein FerR (iron transport regulator)
MKDFLKKYLANACTENEFRSVINLFTSPERQRELEENMQEDWSSRRPQSDVPDLTPDLYKIHFEISRREHLRTGPKRLLVYLTRAAAVLFIPLAIAFLLQLQRKDPAAAILQTISTPLASRTTFDLPDGSKVWLNSGSSVSFPADFSSERKLRLEGEAFFDVKKGNSPFLVEASGFTVTVLGTAFNVMAYDHEQPAVTLERGKISLHSVSGQHMDLEPGQQAVFDTLSHSMTKAKVETRLYSSWTRNRMIFQNEALGSVISRLERWYNVDIQVGDPTLLKTPLTATIEYESIWEVMELMNLTLPISWQYNKSTRELEINRKE